MYSSMVVFVAVLILIFSLVLILIFMIKYLNKRDKENLQIKIKFGFFEFYINASGENIAKKENDYFHNEHHKIHTKNTHLKKRAKK